MNAIDTLIAQAGVRGSLDLRCQFQGDWALDHSQEALGTAPYHIVLAGGCRIQLPDGQRQTLRAGDILLLPGGSGHLLLSAGREVAPSLPRVEEGGVLPVHRFGEPGIELDMLCGRFHYNPASMLLSALPQHLVIGGADLAADSSLRALVQLLRSEAEAEQLGAGVLLDALSSALFTLILRAYLAQVQPSAGPLALLSDKRLKRAWQAMLEAPANDWTIERLAGIAAMSRATFMRVFVRVAGVSPWVLLTQVRMERAFNLLSHSPLGLNEIAAQVGYQSQAAFSKKFKQVYGQAPGRVRRAL